MSQANFSKIFYQQITTDWDILCGQKPYIIFKKFVKYFNDKKIIHHLINAFTVRCVPEKRNSDPLINLTYINLSSFIHL